MAEKKKPSPPPGLRWQAGDVLLAAAGFGMAAGGVEALAHTIRQRVMHRTLYMGPELIWQIPLAEGIVFLAVGLLLVLIGLAIPRVRAPRIVLAVFGGLLAFSAILLSEKIHVAAEALLAAGVGVAVARGLAPRSERVRRVLRLAAPALALVLIALAVGQRALRGSAEHRAVAALPPARAGQPNILLLVLDTVRAWSMGMYGYGRPTTPKLNEWAGQGTLFERALAGAPWTTLSHAVMFTGHYATELSVGWETPYDGQFPTLAEVLRNSGYATAGFAGNYLNLGSATGLDRGFVHYEDYPLQPVSLFRGTTLIGRLFGIDRVRAFVGRRHMVPGLSGEKVNANFLQWIDGQQGRPWFAFLNYFDAHGPYLPPAPFDTMYMGRIDPPVDRYWKRLQQAYGPPPVSIDELGTNLDAYDGAITYLDGQIDALLRALASRGRLANTIIVVTSDHGELFGEHGVLTHGNSLFLPVLHVPLFMVAPGRIPVGARIPSIASLRDLPATLLDLAGIPNPGLPGHSLTAELSAATAAGVTDTLFAAVDYHPLLPKWPLSPLLRGSMRSVVLDSLQYIRNGDGLEELYHLGKDSWEIRNLVSVPEYQADLTRYRRALAALPSR